MNPNAISRLHRDHLLKTMKDGAQLLTELSDRSYRSGFPSLEISAIGEHYRHHLDHIRLFIDGLDERVIDYDQRRRDQDVARDRVRAIEETSELMDALQQIPERQLDGELEVLQCSAKGFERAAVTSTPARELLFLNSHAVHHFAIINIAAGLHGLDVACDIGVAPSTLSYRNEQPGIKPS